MGTDGTIRRWILGLLGGLLVALGLAGPSCDRKLAVEGLDFKVVHDPVQGKLLLGEEVTIRCRIEPEEWGTDPRYTLRYQQLEGKGRLWVDSAQLLPGGSHELGEGDFALRYMSEAEGKHVLELKVSEPYGKERTVRLEFEHDDSAPFRVTHLPVPKEIMYGKTVFMKFRIAPKGKYYLRYFQPEGRGELFLAGGQSNLKQNEKEELPAHVFKLGYTSRSRSLKQVLRLVFIDEKGREVETQLDFAVEEKRFPKFKVGDIQYEESEVKFGEPGIKVSIFLDIEEGDYNVDTNYRIRFRQKAGRGELFRGDPEHSLAYDAYYTIGREEMERGEIVLTYKSRCHNVENAVEEHPMHEVDFTVKDSHGQTADGMFSIRSAKQSHKFSVKFDKHPEYKRERNGLIAQLGTAEGEFIVEGDPDMKASKYTISFRNLQPRRRDDDIVYLYPVGKADATTMKEGIEYDLTYKDFSISIHREIDTSFAPVRGGSVSLEFIFKERLYDDKWSHSLKHQYYYKWR